ncbi:MAG: PDGLE domain-containing protein, partial [Acidimicrobiia bacterium]|nr:PDGLE domain-containing protein [Acidimicrobiia bacterium]
MEWSIAKVTGGAELESGSAGAHAAASVQEKTAILPGYGFKQTEPAADGTTEPAGDKAVAERASPAWPAVSAGTSA